MGRRARDPGDEFSHADLAIAIDATKREVQTVADNGLLPADRSIRDLKRICVIGAFHSAGAPMLAAARLAEKLLWAFNEPDGEMPSGLRYMARGLSGSPRSLPEGAEPSDYWYHRDLYGRPDLYRPGAADRGDAYVEVADREHVFLRSGLKLLPEDALDPEFPYATYEGRLEGWGRGAEPHFHSLAELLEAGKAKAKVPAAGAYRNAVGLLTINASLAIRNGLDRLAEHRKRKAG